LTVFSFEKVLELNHIEPSDVQMDIEQGKKQSSNVWLVAEMGADGIKERNIEALVLLFKMSPILWPFAFLGNLTNFIFKATHTLTLPLVQLCSGCINVACSFFQRITTTDATTSLFGIYVLPRPERPKTRNSRMRKRLLKIACNIFVGFLALEMLCKRRFSRIKSHYD